MIGRPTLWPARSSRSGRRTPCPESAGARAPRAMSRPDPSGSASQGARSKVELTMRNSLMNTPIGGKPTIAKTPNDQAPAEQRMGDGQAPDVGDLLRALDLRDLADGVEDRRFRQAVHRHVQEGGEIGERPADPEGEDDHAHVLDRGIGEHAFHVAATVEHEGGEHDRDEAQRHHQRTWRDRAGVGVEQKLESQDGVERHVEQQAGEHGRDRRRTFGMCVGQPSVQRREADLRPVAEHQKHEGEIERAQDRTPAACAIRLVHSIPWTPSPTDRAGGHIDKDRAEQGKRDADAAEDEIFPRRLDRFRRAVDADHQHRRQRRDLDRRPISVRYCWRRARGSSKTAGTDTSRDRSANAYGVSRPGLDLVRDIGRAEHARGESRRTC